MILICQSCSASPVEEVLGFRLFFRLKKKNPLHEMNTPRPEVHDIRVDKMLIAWLMILSKNVPFGKVDALLGTK